jgi:hypothetical protein
VAPAPSEAADEEISEAETEVDEDIAVESAQAHHSAGLASAETALTALLAAKVRDFICRRPRGWLGWLACFH